MRYDVLWLGTRMWLGWCAWRNQDWDREAWQDEDKDEEAEDQR
jgi:hypothetical protein